MLDWRHYFERYPIPAVAVVACLAFWFMPGRRVAQTVQLDSGSIQEIVRQGGLQMQAPRKRRSWLGGLLSIGSSILLRQGMNYVLQRFDPASMAAATRESYSEVN